MRKHFLAALAITFGMVLSLSVALVHQGTAQGADGSGDFIIRCFYNGHIATGDPIDAPGSFKTDHLHAFFGNMAAGTAAMNGATQVPFPNMTAGEDGSPGTMENTGHQLPGQQGHGRLLGARAVHGSAVRDPEGVATRRRLFHQLLAQQKPLHVWLRDGHHPVPGLQVRRRSLTKRPYRRGPAQNRFGPARGGGREPGTRCALLEQLPGDDRVLDFGGTLVDARGADLAVEVFEQVTT